MREPGTNAIQRGRIEQAAAGTEQALLHYRAGELADAWVVTRDEKGEVLRAEKPLPGGRQVFERTATPVQASENAGALAFACRIPVCR